MHLSLHIQMKTLIGTLTTMFCIEAVYQDERDDDDEVEYVSVG